MKKILFVIGLFISFAASAQFPNKDSLQRYINRWIRNSPVEAFTNLRLNTALNGLLSEVRAIGVANSGILSMSIVTGDTLQIITTASDTFSVALPTGSMAATNLSVSRNATQVNVQSSTGTTGILPPASQFFAGVMTATDKAKLDSTASLALLRDSVDNRLYHIYRRGDSVFYVKSGAEVFAFLADASVGSGTVTNVASGYGLSGGPITSSGTLIVDSATLSTKYIRRADSLTAYTSRYRLDTANTNLRTLIATKLSNITGLVTPGTGVSITGSGTSGSPYVISSDAAGGTVTSVGSGYGLTGGPITGAGTLVVDSATLATKFLRRADTSLIFTDYRNAINARVKYTDTTAMLAAYITSLNSKVKYTDTTSMLAAYQTALNLRVKYSDTSSMLAAYITSLNSKVKYTDTSAMLAAYITALNLRVKYTDTAAMLLPYANKINTKQGIIALTTIGSSGAATFDGSTLNIPSYAGGGGSDNGMTGTGIRPLYQGGQNLRTLIASTGMLIDSTTNVNSLTFRVDTATIFSSLATAINARVKYSDTSSMLSAYITSLNTKVKYSDTATMLAPYATKINTKQNNVTLTTTGTSGAATFNATTGALNIPQYAGTTYTNGYGLNLSSGTFSVDTATILAQHLTAINARVKYTDTAAMLAPYATKINTKQGILSNLGSYYRLFDGTSGLRSLRAINGILIDSATTGGLTIQVDSSIYATQSDLNDAVLAAGGGITSVSGTSNRITSSGGTTPIIDIASTYVGQTSITTLGTVTTAVYQGTVIAGQYGGTGVANTGKTITLGGNLTTSGAFATTLTSTGTTSVTLPTTGTLATLAGSEALTNKSVNGVTLVNGGTATLYLSQDGTYSTPGGSGTVNSGVANRLAYYASTGTAVDDLAAITANRALISDANGLPIASSVTSTTLAFLDITSSAQSQLNNKVDSITLSGGSLKEWKGGTDVTRGTAVTYSFTDLSVGDHLEYDGTNFINVTQTTPLLFTEVNFVVGSGGAPTNGASTFSNDALVGKHVRVWREGDFKYSATSDGIVFNSGTGVITFYPSLLSGERVHIEASSAGAWDEVTLSSPFFVSTTNLNNSSNTWTAPGTSEYGNTGLSDQTLGSGVTGRIIMDGTSNNSVFGFNTANAQVGYAAMEAGFIIATDGTLYEVEGGSLTSISNISTVGGSANKYALYRNGATGAIKIQYSTDGGGSWLDYSGGALSYTSTATLYIVCDIRANATFPGSLVNPTVE